MRPIPLLVSLILPLVIVAHANAQSLISKLPPDGTWATYDGAFTTLKPDGTKHEFAGTITIRSVGEEDDEEQSMDRLRWIEIEQNMDYEGEHIKIIDKVLIPEKEFGLQKSPISNLRKMWRYHSQFGETEPRKVDVKSSEARTLEVLLPPLLDKSKELDPKVFKTPAGEFSCAGHSGERDEPFERSEGKYHRLFESFSSENAPFGSVYFKNETNTIHSGEPGATMIATLTLKEVGTNAKSALPNNN